MAVGSSQRVNSDLCLVRDLVERTTFYRFPSSGDLKWVLNPTDLTAGLPSRPGSLEPEGAVQDCQALDRLVVDLAALEPVAGVALLSDIEAPRLNTLVLEVIAPLSEGDPVTAQTIKAAGRAEADFARSMKRTRLRLPSALRFVNSSGWHLDALERKLRQRWITRELSLCLLALLVFNRS